MSAGYGDFDRWDGVFDPSAEDPRHPTGSQDVLDRTFIQSLAVASNGCVIAANQAAAEIWDPAVARRIARFPSPTRTHPAAVTASGDATWFAVAFGKVAAVHHAGDDGWTAVIRGHKSHLRSVGFSPCNRMFLTAGIDGTVRFWDTDTWAESKRFDFGIGKVTAAAFAPDGLTAAAGGESGEIVVWDIDP